MPVIVVQNSSSSLSGAGDYITNSDKTEIITTTGETKQLISSKNCVPDTAIKEMNNTKKLYGKTGGRTYKHYVQSFDKNDDITAQQVHEIAKKFAQNEKWEGHEVLIATHTDTDHLHTHFVVNSVNFETGKKYQESRKDLQKLKEFSDEIALEYGIKPPQKLEKTEEREKDKTTAYGNRKYQALIKDYDPNTEYQSDLAETAETILDVQEQTSNWQEFEEEIEKQGYQVKWEKKSGGNLKYTTYTHPSGRKFRCRNLRKTLNIIGFNKRMITAIQNPEKLKKSQLKNQIQKIDKMLNNKDKLNDYLVREMEIEKENLEHILEQKIGSEPQKQPKDKTKEKNQGQGRDRF